MSTSPLKMRDFTQADWEAFAGCESTNPQICEFFDGEYLLVRDLNALQGFAYSNDEEYIYSSYYDDANAANNVAEALLHAAERCERSHFHILWTAVLGDPDQYC